MKTSMVHPLSTEYLEILRIEGGWIHPSLIQSDGHNTYKDMKDCLDILVSNGYVSSRKQIYEGIPEFEYSITLKGLSYLSKH